VLETIDALNAIELEWRHFLAEEVRGSNFYNDPAHITLRLESNPQLRPLIIILRRGGLIRCIAPFYLEDGRRQIQFSAITLARPRAKLLALFGTDIPVAVGEDRTSCYELVFRALSEHSHRYDLILLDHVDVAGPLYEFCRRAFSHSGDFKKFPASSESDMVYQIRLGAGFDEYMARRTPKSRRSIRYRTRKLLSMLHARVERVTESDQVPAFLSRLDEIYRDTWQGKFYGARSRMTEEEHRFLFTVAQHGWLRSYILASDTGPLAFVVGFQYNGTFHYHETGYSQKRAELGAGSVLTHLLIEDLFLENPPHTLDFGHGKHAYKRSFGNSNYVVASSYLAPRNRWRSVLALQKLIFAVERFSRASAKRLKLDRLLRRLLQRAGADVGQYG
jgi:hypothetical protein